MYIIKNRHSNYYTRIYLPKPLQLLGYPAEIRFSLLSKNRSEAIDRSVMVLHIVRPWISAQSESTLPEESIEALRNKIKELQGKRFNCAFNPLLASTKPITSNKATKAPAKTNTAYLGEFIAFKERSGIRNSSISLLKTRITHFILLLNKPLAALALADALRYEDTLLDMDNSYKTKKEYLSAAKQFCEWLRRKQVIVTNPLATSTIKIPSNSRSKPSSQRNRWSQKQLNVLFKHPNFAKIPDTETASQSMKENFWIPLLLLYTGARSGEICQLKTSDVYQNNGIWCIDINDKGQDRHLKSPYSQRIIPMHSRLIELGFVDYVKERRNLRQFNLFSFKPVGIDKDWSKGFAMRFSKVLGQCGFIEKARPTLHSFRHTFIDELQQVGVEEHVTSELVGHSKQNLTYGRYGKRLHISVLSESIEKLIIPRIEIIKIP
ncbi:hypothetical protein AAY62_08845 [Vibrio parahaemolyticus]|uniref:site-specific integrase n=1 Tax=Vibrio parahaemolyticus TaxID=670 RepID=UPI00063E9F97|nr:site-specific integrase [Vibrio parahaemolyticus]KLI85644.1 hypothetical protein AAY62_08845 [Vibrio parahaemolyticus]